MKRENVFHVLKECVRYKKAQHALLLLKYQNTEHPLIGETGKQHSPQISERTYVSLPQGLNYAFKVDKKKKNKKKNTHLFLRRQSIILNVIGSCEGNSAIAADFIRFYHSYAYHSLS